jgi:hypothetical protein
VSDASDNCVSVANPGQENRNVEVLDLPPPVLYDDFTNPKGSVLGDACHPDVDYDWLTPAEESANGTDPDDPDSDGDRILDGAEVTCGSDPNSSTSRPTGDDLDFDGMPDACEPAAGVNPSLRDTDGDGFPDGIEFLRLGTDPNDTNTDNDQCGDGKEITSINEDSAVNVIDVGQIAARVNGTYHFNYDVNRDGQINVVDLLLASQQVGLC